MHVLDNHRLPGLGGLAGSPLPDLVGGHLLLLGGQVYRGEDGEGAFLFFYQVDHALGEGEVAFQGFQGVGEFGFQVPGIGDQDGNFVQELQFLHLEAVGAVGRIEVLFHRIQPPFVVDFSRIV